MPVKKRKYVSGQVVWCYRFDATGSTRLNRRECKGSGFSTKQEATDAEAARRIEDKKIDMARPGVAGIAAAAPTTLDGLLQEFFREYVDPKMASKTIQHYHTDATYLAPELLAMPLASITPLHLHCEWERLLKCGGHARYTRAPRPLAAKTVRGIACLVSSAFACAIRWGLVATNPVVNSDCPRVKRHQGVALTTPQQDLVVASESKLWCMQTFLELAAATGGRRGELLALRWSDITDGRATIARSLTQTRTVFAFKATKTERDRTIRIPDSAMAALDEHRKRQDEFKRQLGTKYQAGDLIFCNPNGSPLKPNTISASVSRLFRRLKMPKGASLHSLRHTHASHLLADGVSLPAVSARLGHSSVLTTAGIYAHAIHGMDDEAAAKWDAFQKRNRPTAPEQVGGTVSSLAPSACDPVRP
jgi:integrase